MYYLKRRNRRNTTYLHVTVCRGVTDAPAAIVAHADAPAALDTICSHVQRGCRQISSGQISSGQISSGQISSGQISSGKISSGQISSGQISSGHSAEWWFQHRVRLTR